MEAEIYAAVLHRLAQVDHGWGRPYTFEALFVLDHAVPDVENPQTDLDDPLVGDGFDEALKTALQAKMADVPPVSFIHTVFDVYDASRQGPIQVRNGGAFVALGPVHEDGAMAVVSALFYGGHTWARWIRYRLEQRESSWHIASSETLAVS